MGGDMAGSNSGSGQANKWLDVPEVQGKNYGDKRIGRGIPGSLRGL